MLTVWRPGADWEAVQEGKRYCMYSLAASLSRYFLFKDKINSMELLITHEDF